MSGGSVEVSVVLPSYNEEATIENTVETTLDTLESFLPPDSFEVIVAEDGCDDRTPEIADRMAAQDKRVRHFHSDERLGRGGALNRAFEESNGETLVYFDTDLATDMRHLEELVESVRSGEYDFATGSRWMPENVADRPAKRDVASRGFNGLTRLFLRSDLRDHQCGFKAFDRTALFDVLADVGDNHWFWDTEVLVRAQRKGYKIKEFSVDWTPKGDTKVDLVRDVFGMGSQIGRCWWEFTVAPRITRGVSMAVGVLLTIIAVALMGRYLPLGKVLDQMEHANLALVALAAVVYVFSWPLRGVRYKNILEKLGYTESTGFLTGAIFISQTGNLVFPARLGDGVRAYVMKARRSIPYPSGFASLAVERVFDLLTITVLAGVVLIGLTVTGQAATIVQAVTGAKHAEAARTAVYVAAGVGVLAIAAVAVIIASARSDSNLVRSFVTRVSSDSYANHIAGIVERFTGDVQMVANDREAFASVGLSSLAIWSLDVLTAILVLTAFRDVSLTLVTLVAIGFFAVSVGNLAKVLPLSPGGVGLYEAAFTVFVAGLTPIPWEVALGAAIVDHAVKNVVTLVGGVGSMFSLNVSLTQAVEEGRDVSVEEPASLDD
ncbi:MULTISPECIES: flippase-like domain-containing protein [unclassified Haladaptatus]|uniref:flippase-like domain-containing protein n=1 Tax=unclassified Haladaptatus TaxID=2622732 RepID=UPI00209BEFD3|nr:MULTISPECIES: flippase-like domain-containing protein [unclassified Haladaptatus]MCO8244503.1 flippase-like domain-containing protein [Haladaptatus sp. AB643]MCO8253875.1 flippase-like domain-containing protein [Haladaptatus sp. AB618]